MSKRFRKMTALLLSVVMVTLMIPIPTISVSAGTVIENAISWALGIADDDSHGYSQLQNRRWGNPDYDCSTFVITAFAKYSASSRVVNLNLLSDDFSRLMISACLISNPA